jgi:hypothetical protein
MFIYKLNILPLLLLEQLLSLEKCVPMSVDWIVFNSMTNDYNTSVPMRSRSHDGFLTIGICLEFIYPLPTYLPIFFAITYLYQPNFAFFFQVISQEKNKAVTLSASLNVRKINFIIDDRRY